MHLGKQMFSTNKLVASLDFAITEQQELQRRAWWKGWYEADYSWEGLAAKSMPFREGLSQDQITLSLQEFWASEAEHLVTADDGRQYTRFHYPFYTFVDGDLVATDKGRWKLDLWAQLDKVLLEVLKYRALSLTYEQIDELRGFQRNRAFFPGRTTDELTPVFLNLSGINLLEMTSTIATTNNIQLAHLYIDKVCVRSFQKPVLEDVVFQDCLFGSGLTFQDGSMIAGLQLKSCCVAGPITLKNAELGKIYIEDVWCKYLEMIDSRPASIKVNAVIAQPDACRFHHSNVSGDVDFRGSGLTFLGAFDGLKIAGQLRFDHEQDGTPADTVFRRKILAPILSRTDRSVFRNDPHHPLSNWYTERSRQLRHLESGARVLKTTMTEEKNEEMAHRFYRYELWARNYNPGTERGTRWLLTLYRATSRYGHDVTLPLLWIFGIAMVTGFFYMFAYTAASGWTFASPSLAAWQYAGDAWSFSIGRIAPIIPWAAGIQVPKDTFEYGLKMSDGWIGFAIHFIAILQTSISTALFFLAGLAARRRFKMAD